MIKRVSEDLIKKIDLKKHENFNLEVKSGKKLTFAELQRLSHRYKSDYIKLQLLDDTSTQAHCINTLQNIEGAIGQMMSSRDEVQGMMSLWDGHMSKLVDKDVVEERVAAYMKENATKFSKLR